MKIKILLLLNIIIIGLLLLSLQAMAKNIASRVEPFRAECYMGNSTSKSFGHCTLSKEIPAGKRLIPETVTGYIGDGAVLGMAYLTIEGIRYVFPWVISGTSFDAEPTSRKFYGFNHVVKLYVDGPAILEFDTVG